MLYICTLYFSLFLYSSVYSIYVSWIRQSAFISSQRGSCYWAYDIAYRPIDRGVFIYGISMYSGFSIQCMLLILDFLYACVIYCMSSCLYIRHLWTPRSATPSGSSAVPWKQLLGLLWFEEDGGRILTPSTLPSPTSTGQQLLQVCQPPPDPILYCNG